MDFRTNSTPKVAQEMRTVQRIIEDRAPILPEKNIQNHPAICHHALMLPL